MNIVKPLLALILFALNTNAFAAPNYTIYLVRHAEKQQGSDNPHLTQCGKFRAMQLSQMLKNVELKKIYSTSYFRTLETATPTAELMGLGIKQYAPNGLLQLARQVKQDKENVLIVGHSNTTPELASVLLNHDVQKMTEVEYQHLFQIQVVGDQFTLTKLTQPLDCTAFN